MFPCPVPSQQPSEEEVSVEGNMGGALWASAAENL